MLFRSAALFIRSVMSRIIEKLWICILESQLLINGVFLKLFLIQFAIYLWRCELGIFALLLHLRFIPLMSTRDSNVLLNWEICMSRNISQWCLSSGVASGMPFYILSLTIVLFLELTWWDIFLSWCLFGNF